MGVLQTETLPVRRRKRCGRWFASASGNGRPRLGFSLVEQTKIVTAASELARNVLIHGGGGEARLRFLIDRRGSRRASAHFRRSRAWHLPTSS